ncbi:MAG: UbiA prenyltransferase family protein [Chitinophagaceae bacterium]|nr:UbiA prenyltransferase family protein [Chitinophagaceae bacterium]
MKTSITNNFKLLRLPFSIFLLPISLFSIFYIRPHFNFQLALVLVIWHLLVFPASNAYNSYHDRDEGPIGALEAPPKPTRSLLQIANLMDGLAIWLSILVNLKFAAFVSAFILVSRLYSNREVRLKKYPVLAFLIVCLCQGTGVFVANFFGLSSAAMLSQPSIIYSAIACYFFIGTIYPVTQIYQHDADARDGVRTLSLVLGIKGTFIFSGLMFLLATLFIYLSFGDHYGLDNFWLFILVMLPATIYFISWATRSFRNRAAVNFKNTMIQLLLSSLLNNIYFLILLIK